MRRIAHAACLAAGLMLAACGKDAPPETVVESAPAATEAGPEKGAENSAIPAPEAANVALALTVDDDGGAFSLAVGERLSVSLIGVPTAGYLWEEAETPATLRAVSLLGGPTTMAQLEPGFTGGHHWEVLVFEAIAPGEGVLVLEQRRSWEDDTPPADTWSATITVTPAE